MKPASPRRGDAGFTIVEVIVAVLIIGGALLTVVAAATNGVLYQGASRTRQTAVGIATQVMEQLRALPRANIEKGLLNSSISAVDTNVASCPVGSPPTYYWKLFSCSPVSGKVGSGELLVTYAVAGAPFTQFAPLNYVPSVPSTYETDAIDGVKYRYRAYVTTAADRSYRFTVIVTWRWRSRDYAVQTQSVAAFPSGCLGPAANLIGAPCGTGTGGSGGGDGVSISVTWIEPTATCPAAAQPACQFTFATSAAKTFVSYKIQGSAPAFSAVSLNPDGTRAVAAADTDLNTADPVLDAPPQVPMWSGGTPANQFEFSSSYSATNVNGVITTLSPYRLRARYFSDPLGVMVAAGAQSFWPESIATVNMTPGATGQCGVTSLTPCANAQNQHFAKGANSQSCPDGSVATTPAVCGGLVVEYLTSPVTPGATTTGFAYPLVEIPGVLGGNTNACAVSTTSYCLWKSSTYLKTEIPAGSSARTLSFNVLRQFPLIRLGGFCLGAGNVVGSAGNPNARTQCDRYLATFSICDYFKAYLRTEDGSSLTQPPSSNPCGSNTPPEYFDEPSNYSLSRHYYAFKRVTQASNTQGQTTNYCYAYTQQGQTYTPITPSLTAAPITGYPDPVTVTWCDSVNGTRWDLSALTFRPPFGTPTTGWTEGASIRFTYKVYTCASGCTSNADPAPTTMWTEVTPAGGLKVQVSFPIPTVLATEYDDW